MKTTTEVIQPWNNSNPVRQFSTRKQLKVARSWLAVADAWAATGKAKR